jgi:hypothetical protein
MSEFKFSPALQARIDCGDITVAEIKEITKEILQRIAQDLATDVIKKYFEGEFASGGVIVQTPMSRPNCSYPECRSPITCSTLGCRYPIGLKKDMPLGRL